MIAVTFRNSYDKLTSMFETHYNSVKAAKAAIESDALAFKDAHSHSIGKKSHGNQAQLHSGWVNPETEDYYEVQAKDGTSCIWQYFKI